MRKMIVIAAAFGMLSLGSPATASDYDDSQSHPLLIASQLLHPVEGDDVSARRDARAASLRVRRRPCSSCWRPW